MASAQEYWRQVEECARQIQSSALTFQERIKHIGIRACFESYVEHLHK